MKIFRHYRNKNKDLCFFSNFQYLFKNSLNLQTPPKKFILKNHHLNVYRKPQKIFSHGF